MYSKEACTDDAQVAKRWSRWSDMVSLELIITLRTLMVVTLSALCITGRAGHRVLYGPLFISDQFLCF